MTQTCRHIACVHECHARGIGNEAAVCSLQPCNTLQVS